MRIIIENVKKGNKLNLVSAIVLSTGIVAGATAILPLSTTTYAATVNVAQQTTQAAGIKLSKDSKTNTVTLTQGKNHATLELDSDSAVVRLNGSSIGDRYEAKSVKGVDYVAAEAVDVLFGYQIHTDLESGNTIVDRNEMNKVTMTGNAEVSARERSYALDIRCRKYNLG